MSFVNALPLCLHRRVVNPARCVAPDVFVRLGVPDTLFDPEASVTKRLRVWDRVDGDLVERSLDHPSRPPCLTLTLHWVVVPADDLPVTLRLSRDPEGKDLVLTQAEAKAARATAESARAEPEARARASAEQRIVEEELRQRDGKA